MAVANHSAKVESVFDAVLVAYIYAETGTIQESCVYKSMIRSICLASKGGYLL